MRRGLIKREKAGLRYPLKLLQVRLTDGLTDGLTNDTVERFLALNGKIHVMQLTAPLFGAILCFLGISFKID